MPLFEYHCKTCDQTIEVLQKDARVLTECGHALYREQPDLVADEIIAFLADTTKVAP